MSDLDVVDSVSYLIIRSYDQILLVCLIVYHYIPDRDTMNASFGQRRAAKICPNEQCPDEARYAEVSPAELRCQRSVKTGQ